MDLGKRGAWGKRAARRGGGETAVMYQRIKKRLQLIKGMYSRCHG